MFTDWSAALRTQAYSLPGGHLTLICLVLKTWTNRHLNKPGAVGEEQSQDEQRQSALEERDKLGRTKSFTK